MVRLRTNPKQLFACKLIDLGKSTKEDADREYAILRRLEHPHIVGYVDYQCTPKTVITAGGSTSLLKVGLFMEYCPQGSLQDLIDRRQQAQDHVAEDVIWKIFGQVSSALRYCHYGVGPKGSPQAGIWQPVLHRDIKPANVLVVKIEAEDFVVKLGDFGLATIVDPERAPNSYAGTRPYQPPEISRLRERAIRWTKSCDIFSLGCTIYAVCALSPPFKYRMEEGDTCAELPDFYTKRLKDCVSRCQALQPEDRHDAFDLVSISAQVQETWNYEERKADNLAESRTQQQSPLLARSVENSFAESSTMTRHSQHHTYDTWNSMIDAGIHCYDKCEFQEANRTFSEATEHCIEVYGLEHVNTAKSRYWLGRGQCKLKKDVEAEHSFKSAVEIYEKVLGQEHIDTARSIYLLGRVQYELKEYVEAEHSLKSVVEIYEKVLGQEHIDTARSIYWLGRVQYNLKKYAEAEPSWSKARSIQTKILGANHSETIRTNRDLSAMRRSGHAFFLLQLETSRDIGRLVD